MNKRTSVCPRRESQSLRYFDLVYQYSTLLRILEIFILCTSICCLSLANFSFFFFFFSFLPHRFNCSNKSHRLKSIDWTFSPSSVADATTSDVVAPSSWTIFGCQNGRF